jgi:hypothetical protein
MRFRTGGAAGAVLWAGLCAGLLQAGCAAAPSDPEPAELPFTFLIASDTHYGVRDSVAIFNRLIIESMNGLPGTASAERCRCRSACS